MLLIAATAPFGCRTTRTLELTQSGAPAFERFSAEYEIPTAHMHLDRTFAGESEAASPADDSAVIQPVAAETEESQDAPPAKPIPDETQLLDRTRAARLTIECPAASDRPEEARLTLEVQTGSTGTGAESASEVRELIVPRQQVELLIVDLARAGFFDGGEPPGARSSLSVAIDGARVTRSWRIDDRLLDFAHRVLHRGRTAAD